MQNHSLLKVGLGHAEASCLKDAAARLWLVLWTKNNKSKNTLSFEERRKKMERFLERFDKLRTGESKGKGKLSKARKKERKRKALL